MYSIAKTAKKASLPVVILVLVRIAIAAAKESGVEIDEQTVYEIALGGYAGIIALINWIKNRKKK